MILRLLTQMRRWLRVADDACLLQALSQGNDQAHKDAEDLPVEAGVLGVAGSCVVLFPACTAGQQQCSTLQRPAYCSFMPGVSKQAVLSWGANAMLCPAACMSC